MYMIYISSREGLSQLLCVSIYETFKVQRCCVCHIIHSLRYKYVRDLYIESRRTVASVVNLCQLLCLSIHEIFKV